MDHSNGHPLTGDTPERRSNWQARAACGGSDPELFFPEGRVPNEVRKICWACIVRPACLRDVIQTGVEDRVHGHFGVRAGLNPEEIRVLIDKARRRADRRRTAAA